MWISTLQKKARARALAALVETRLPADFDLHGDQDAWPFVATGLVARQAGTMLSIVDLEPSGRVTDLAVLVRGLFEHVVHFARLAGAPATERIEAWRKHDLSARLTAARDGRDHGVSLMTDKESADMERERDSLRGGPMKLIDLAVGADETWQKVLPGFGASSDAQSFRKLYATVYRHTSAFAHPTWRGLHRVTIDAGALARRVVMEAPDPAYPLDPVGLGTMIFGTGLFVAGDILGWPERDQVLAVFERFPDTQRIS